MEALMDYMTSADAAKLWNLSQRRIQCYCKLGKIEGAIIVGNRWLLPKNATKPVEKKGRPKKTIT